MIITAEDFLKKVNANQDTTSCEVSGPLFFQNLYRRDCLLRNVIFKESVFIMESFDFVYYFEDCHFEKGFAIDEGTKLKTIYFINCKFETNNTIEKCEIGKFSISKCSFEGSFIFSYVIITELSLSSISNGKNTFKFSESKISQCRITKIVNDCNIFFDRGVKDQEIGYGIIEKLTINCDLGYDGKLTFYMVTIKNLSMKGFNEGGHLFFQSVIFKLVDLYRFTNIGIFKISSPEFLTEASLHLDESNLGKCELFNIDFRRIQKIKIIFSNIQDIIPVNITWCDKVIGNETGSSNNLREVYRQLKNVMIRNNDKIEELYYHKLEMDSYNSDLNSSRRNFNEKFILYTNKISNDFGLSWVRSLYWIIGLSLVVFNLNKILLGYNSFDINLFWKDAANWIQSINPVRKFSDVFTDYSTGWQSNLALFIDVLSRIIYSYLIFQFISAFRKYVKK